jgi:hypothetical protein
MNFVNPQTGILSTAYERFVEPISNGEHGGFDVHIYYFQVKNEVKELRESF